MRKLLRIAGCGLLAAVLLLAIAPAFARTITLTDNDADKMAIISPEAPRASWIGCDVGPGIYCCLPIQVAEQRSFLIHFPLDKIPKGYRITKAEWTIPVEYVWGAGTRLFVWRLLEDWGPGVCYQYRTVRPKPIEWNVPGAAGNSSDRAASPTLIVTPKGPGDTITLNVTRDVEFWYTGAAPNNGWVFTVEDEGGAIRLSSPLSTQGLWKLRITYEPQ